MAQCEYELLSSLAVNKQKDLSQWTRRKLAYKTKTMLQLKTATQSVLYTQAHKKLLLKHSYSISGTIIHIHAHSLYIYMYIYIYINIYITVWLTSGNCFTLISSLAISKLSLEERPVHSFIHIIENFLSATTQTLCASTSNSAPSLPQKSALLFGATRCSHIHIG